ncbi:MAG: NADP-dependent malic enzyme [Candidatus Moranbacteria bacterium]|nr:NADP-dependent malic enzyme [Candidatus Moranbacteria bacterium]
MIPQGNLSKQSLSLHRKLRGKIETKVKARLANARDLALTYTPGVAAVSKSIAKNCERAYKYTIKNNTVAVITDGSAVLGLGNAGPEAAIPVMEGKCAIFKNFAQVNAFPICLKTQNTSEIIKIIKNISPIFGGINLEDISAPRCFEIEKRLSQKLNIPVFHDDQHGTAIVVLAGVINALKVVKKRIKRIKAVINGAGAAGYAIAKLMHQMGANNIVMLDSKGIISRKRDYLYPHKKKLLKILAKNPAQGKIKEALKGADIFIGVSKGNLLKQGDIKIMNGKPIVFALANPEPEIMPDLAKRGGAVIVATGRSDFPNQINNALVFPGFFRGLLDARAARVTDQMKLSAARALADLIKKPSLNNIIPSIFDRRVVPSVAGAVKAQR